MSAVLDAVVCLLKFWTNVNREANIICVVVQTGEVFEVKADMPGVGKHNIKVCSLPLSYLLPLNIVFAAVLSRQI